MGNSQPAKMFEKLIVIDCRGHLLGRLASFVAKEALAGQKIMLVRAEEINLSGSFIRNKLHLLMRKQKRMSTNPRRGPFHHRSPLTCSCAPSVECSHTRSSVALLPSSASRLSTACLPRSTR